MEDLTIEDIMLLQESLDVLDINCRDEVEKSSKSLNVFESVLTPVLLDNPMVKEKFDEINRQEKTRITEMKEQNLIYRERITLLKAKLISMKDQENINNVTEPQ